jgi:predicted lipid-binding transport protein (Tim44 family)
MLALLTRCTPFLLAFFTLAFLEAGILTDYSDARSRSGGRTFSSPASRPAQQQAAPSQVNRQQPAQQTAAAGGMGRGLMGGLIGGAIGGMLLGSLFGAGGSGMGILPLLLLGGVGYFLYRRFVKRPAAASAPGGQAPTGSLLQGGAFGGFGSSAETAAPIPPIRDTDPVAAGLAEIRATDPGFDEKYFQEIASDVFFKIQAGWTRRDLSSYGHLLGKQLASEYEEHFKEMKEQGRLNKLESIAVRRLEIVTAGSDNGEDFITVLFTANLLQYTVDENTGELLEGSMTEPVKFAEKWTWARPVGTNDWKLEGIEVVED